MKHLFKSRILKTLIILLIPAFVAAPAEAQILKKIGNKIERSVERRVDRKIDSGVEKGLDKVEDGVDKSVKDATSEKPEKQKASGEKVNQAAPAAASDDLPYSVADAETARTNNGLVLVSANCNDFAWFKKGAVLEYEVKGIEKSDNYTNQIKVADVRKDGAKTVADILSSDHQGNEIEMNFICSGNQLYFDLTGMLKSQMEKHGQQSADMDISFDGGLMSIPKNIYPGQQLDDVEFTMSFSGQGMAIMMTALLKERKVLGKESVTTPAGTFDCIKISGVRTMHMKMMGMNRKMGKPITEHMYFAPGIGIIKSVSHNQKGKVEYEQQLTKYTL